MELFQKWIMSQINVIKTHKEEEFTLKFFGISHTISVVAGEHSLIVSLNLNVLSKDDEELCISQKMVNMCGGTESAIKLRIAEFFISSLDNPQKKAELSIYNRCFGGAVSLFEFLESKKLKEIVEKSEPQSEKQEVSKKNQKIIKHAISDLQDSVEAYARLLSKRIESKLKELQ